MFIYNKKTKARFNANMQEGIFTMSKNTYSDLLTRWAHTQTHAHKMKRNPESYWTPTAVERDKLGVRVRW